MITMATTRTLAATISKRQPVPCPTFPGRLRRPRRLRPIWRQGRCAGLGLLGAGRAESAQSSSPDGLHPYSLGTVPMSTLCVVMGPGGCTRLSGGRPLTPSAKTWCRRDVKAAWLLVLLAPVGASACTAAEAPAPQVTPTVAVEADRTTPGGPTVRQCGSHYANDFDAGVDDRVVQAGRVSLLTFRVTPEGGEDASVARSKSWFGSRPAQTPASRRRPKAQPCSTTGRGSSRQRLPSHRG